LEEKASFDEEERRKKGSLEKQRKNECKPQSAEVGFAAWN